MIAFFEKLKAALEQESIVLATIVRITGSAPREVGAKMAIFADGKIIGTIGGGAGEAKVIQHALTMFETSLKKLIQLDLSRDQGVCGGLVDVWLERWAGEEAINLVNQI